MKKCLLLRTSFWAAIYLSTHPVGAYPGDHDGLNETQNPSPLASFIPSPLGPSLSHNPPLDDQVRHDKWQAFLTSPFAHKNPQRALLDIYEDSLNVDLGFFHTCHEHYKKSTPLNTSIRDTKQAFAKMVPLYLIFNHKQFFCYFHSKRTSLALDKTNHPGSGNLACFPFQWSKSLAERDEDQGDPLIGALCSFEKISSKTQELAFVHLGWA